MFRLVLVSILVAVSLDASPQPLVPMLDGRIVGGESATIEELPYQLSLQIYRTHICGASIISADKALTAAHCVNRDIPLVWSVRAGSSYYNRGGQVIRVSSICQHPNYNPLTMDNDVSVLILESAIELGAGAQPVALHPSGQDVAVGNEATVSGWGSLSLGGSISRKLRRVNVPRVNDDDCNAAYGRYFNPDSMICFGFRLGGKDSCKGDSGGPLVANNELVGIASWGRGCAEPSYPGVYASVSKLRNHIDSC